jgi:hypothetical protein
MEALATSVLIRADSRPFVVKSFICVNLRLSAVGLRFSFNSCPFAVESLVLSASISVHPRLRFFLRSIRGSAVGR